MAESKKTVKQYITYKETMSSDGQTDIHDICREFQLDGVEVFMDDIVSREKPLYADEQEKVKLMRSLQAMEVKRLHCSYWAYPTSFLTKNVFSELIERFGGIDNVKAYYGDLSGNHMWERLTQEYDMACQIGAESYTFHLIDYAPIDGQWEFTIMREDIRQAMIYFIQQFLTCLEEKSLLSADSPRIDIENAGWGLEYGMQTGGDYEVLFEQLYDPWHKVKIGWDINHLLHAVGRADKDGQACFMLPEEELTEAMRNMQNKYASSPAQFACEWIKSNILNKCVADKVGTIHLSDCALKEYMYFLKGGLTGKYRDEIDRCSSWEEKENYGVDIVLSKYDSHLPIGEGILDMENVKHLLKEILVHNKEVSILHELKNSTSLAEDVKKQLF